MGRGKTAIRPSLSHSKGSVKNDSLESAKYIPPSKRNSQKQLKTKQEENYNKFIGWNNNKTKKVEKPPPDLSKEELFPSLSSLGDDNKSNTSNTNINTSINFANALNKSEVEEKVEKEEDNGVEPGWMVMYKPNSKGPILKKVGKSKNENKLIDKNSNLNSNILNKFNLDAFNNYLDRLEDEEDERFEIYGDLEFYKNPWDSSSYESEYFTDSCSSGDESTDSELFAEDPP